METDTAAASSEPVAPGSEMATPDDNKTGRYELFAIITHQGRTAEGGHYVAWVKQTAKKWLVFDDETVAEVDAERIKELYGGSGDVSWPGFKPTGLLHTHWSCLRRTLPSKYLAGAAATARSSSHPVHSVTTHPRLVLAA